MTFATKTGTFIGRAAGTTAALGVHAAKAAVQGTGAFGDAVINSARDSYVTKSAEYEARRKQALLQRAKQYRAALADVIVEV